MRLVQKRSFFQRTKPQEWSEQEKFFVSSCIVLPQQEHSPITSFSEKQLFPFFVDMKIDLYNLGNHDSNTVHVCAALCDFRRQLLLLRREHRRDRSLQQYCDKVEPVPCGDQILTLVLHKSGCHQFSMTATWVSGVHRFFWTAYSIAKDIKSSNSAQGFSMN